MRKTILTSATLFASLVIMSSSYAATVFTEQAPGTSFNRNTQLGEPVTNEIKAEKPDYSLGSTTRSERSQFLASQSAEGILGMNVVAQNGENLGEIKDIRVDTESGRMNYVIVQKGGALGLGEEVAVPLEALQFTDDNARLIVDKAKLDNAPRPANVPNQEFQRGLETHYGVSPAWEERGTR